MYRRRFLESACTASLGLWGGVTTVSGSDPDPTPPGEAWRRVYDDLPVASIAPAHGDGYVLVGRGNGSESEEPLRVVTVDGMGSIHQRRKIRPDTPDDATRAIADVVRTRDGYAVATGPWFADLDADLSVESTGFAFGYTANSTTYLAELPDGFAVALEHNTPDHVSTRVLGFDTGGELRWSRTYGEDRSSWLKFLLAGPDPDGGIVVGGRAGDPWLANLAADGTERWRTTVTDAPPGVGHAATRDDDGIVLFGSSSLVRLDSSRSVDWLRSYDPFRDASDGVLARTADGGYVVAGTVALDRIRVGRTDVDGRLRWSQEYTVVEGAASLDGIVEHAPGEYLVVGTRRDDQSGWGLLLSGTETPPPTRTPTPSPTDPPTGTPRGTPTGTAGSPVATETAAGTAPSGNDTVPPSTPGFGAGAALLGLGVGACRYLYRNWE